MTTNVTIFNAAVAGYLGGACDGRYSTDAVGADDAGIVSAASAFATAVDTAISATSTTVKEANLCQAICQGVISGRYANSGPALISGSWTPVAAFINALFTAGKAILQ